MNAKDITIIVLAVALAGVSYGLGYRSGQLRDSEVRAARGRLTAYVMLYDAAQRGDLGQLRSHLGIMVSGMTRTFEREFGAPDGTNSFAQRFAKAQAIAAQVEKSLVPLDSVISDLNNPTNR